MQGSPGLLLLDGGIGHLLKAKGVESLVPGLEYDQVPACLPDQPHCTAAASRQAGGSKLRG